MSGAVARNRKKRGVGKRDDPEAFIPTKEEKAIAKFLRFNLKNKEGTCLGNQVHYFAGSKAVDLLLTSKWASASKKDDTVLFTNRQSCIDYCQNLLEKDMFKRVYRIRKQKKDKKEKKKEKEKEKTTEEETPVDSENKPLPDESKEEKKKDKEKKPRKPAKLEPHEDQWFIDGGEKDGALYVWIFDPVSTKTWLMGIAVIIGAIAACLYPLWPMELRLGVYYICLGLMGLLGLLIVLAIVRFFIFCGVWIGTVGGTHFWLFPNLFEECGILESFQPTYSITSPSDKKAKKKCTNSTSKNEENQDNEDDKKNQSDSSEKGDFEVLRHSDFDQANDNSNEEEDSEAENTDQ